MNLLRPLAIASLTFVSVTALPAALPVQPVSAQLTPRVPCAIPSISVDPTTVKRGNSVTLKGSFTNCSTNNKRYKFTLKLTGPNNFDLTVGPLTVSVPTNKTYTRSESVKIPSFAPVGDYSATVIVRSFSGNLLNSASTALTVTK
ncbi:MAG TPA: hypothetical protein V6D19_24345 [Stenomitos sp.]